jgi:dTDP-glucose 4,6-dehydratase
LHGIPWTVFRGHARTSTYLADTVYTLANMVNNFKPGETYNIGGERLHTIEELSNLILKITDASPSLVRYRAAEPMTTTAKRVDVSKAVRDLNHRNTYSLEQGLRLTTEWMRQVYKIGPSPGEYASRDHLGLYQHVRS